MTLQYIFLAVALAGMIQITCGVLRLGKFIRMVPHSVMLGFVNGLAIVICLAQFERSRTPRPASGWLSIGMGTMAVLALVTMA